MEFLLIFRYGGNYVPVSMVEGTPLSIYSFVRGICGGGFREGSPRWFQHYSQDVQDHKKHAPRAPPLPAEKFLRRYLSNLDAWDAHHCKQVNPWTFSLLCILHLLQVKFLVKIKNTINKSLKPSMSLGEINKKLGDLTLAKELDFETTVNDFLLKKFEDTSYYKYMKLRIKNE